MRFSRILLAAVALLVACGGRDELYVDGPLPSRPSPGGEGGEGGMGGMGGMPTPQGGGGCNSLQLVSPIATPLDGNADGAEVRSGRLTFAKADSDTIALVASYNLGPGPAELRHTAFEPWDAWPADGLLAAGHLIDATGVTNFEAARGIEGHFAVSYINTVPTPVGLTVGIDYLANNGQPAQLGDLVALEAERLRSSARGISVFTQAQPNGQQQLFGVLPLQLDTGFTWVGPMIVGCTAGEPLVATAGTFSGGLVALHQGSDMGVGCGAGPVTEPQNIRIGSVLYGFDAGVYFGAQIDTPPLMAMRMFSDGEGGAWLVWQTTEELTSLKATRLNDKGQPIGSMFDLAGGVVGSWDAHVNEGVLWAAFINPSGELMVRRHDTNGALLASGELAIAPGEGAPEVLAAPDGEQVVVAYPEQGEQGPAVRVAKFACAP